MTIPNQFLRRYYSRPNGRDPSRPSVRECDRPPRHAGERIIGHDDRYARFFRQEFVDIAQESASTGQNDAMLGDIAPQFRRSLFQRLLHDADDALEGFLQSFENLVAVQRKPGGTPSARLRPVTDSSRTLQTGISGPDFQFDAFGGRLADQDPVVPANVVHDRFVQAITADAG